MIIFRTGWKIANLICENYFLSKKGKYNLYRKLCQTLLYLVNECLFQNINYVT